MSNFLVASILSLNREAIVGLRLTDAYSVHRIVYSLFEDIRAETDKYRSLPSGILYADLGVNAEIYKILLLSNRLPAHSKIQNFGSIVSKIVPPSFLQANQYFFKVTVNPTRRSGQTGSLFPIRNRALIHQWFLEKSNGWGFCTKKSEVYVGQVGVLNFKKKDCYVTLAQADIFGQLNVLDRGLFQQSFERGIGRGRAFGCGLLQLVPR